MVSEVSVGRQTRAGTFTSSRPVVMSMARMCRTPSAVGGSLDGLDDEGLDDGTELLGDEGTDDDTDSGGGSSSAGDSSEVLADVEEPGPEESSPSALAGPPIINALRTSANTAIIARIRRRVEVSMTPLASPDPE